MAFVDGLGGGVKPVYLAERDEQLRRLDRAFADCDRGRGTVVLINGPIACGKTEMIRAAVERAAARDLLTLTATCFPAEQGLPFGVLGQLVRGAPPEVDVRVEQLLAAHHIRPAEGAPAAADRNTIRMFHQLCLVLLELARSRSVLIAVDDVRHADPESVQCLLHLVRRLGTARIVVLLTDDAEHGRHSQLRAELLRQTHLLCLSVEPLSPAGVAAVLQDHVDAGTAARLGDEVFSVSGGNPLLVRTLIDDHSAEGAVRAQGYGLTLLGCLHRASPSVVAVARALAVLGHDQTPALLSRIAGVDLPTLAAAQRTMSTAGLIGTTGLRHEVARTTVLENVPTAERAGLHVAAAAALHDSGAPLDRIADHLVRAGRAEQPWEINALLETADQALANGQPAAATTLLTVAGECRTNRRQQTTILARLTEAQWQLSPSAAGRHLGRLSERARAGELVLGDQLTLARHLLWHGHSGEAKDLIDRVRVTTAESRDAAEFRAFDLWLACSHPPLAGPRQAPVTSDGQPTELVGSTYDPWLRTAARLADLLVRGKQHDGHRLAQEVLSGLHLSRRTAWVEESAMLAVLVLANTGRPDDAAHWCSRFSVDTQADQSGASTWAALAAATTGNVALRRGDLKAAAAQTQVALAALSRKSWGVAIAYPLGGLVLAATYLGDYEDAARHLTLATAEITEEMLRSRYALPFLHARGHYHLATNHGYAALSDFLSCGELARSWGLDLADLVPWRTSAAAAWLRIGNTDQAKLLAYEQLGRPGMARSRTRGLALRLLAAASPPARRPALLTEALELVQDFGDRLEQARVLADLTDTYTRLGDERRARMIFRRAWHAAELCGARPLCQDLLATTGDLRSTVATGTMPGAAATLTSSERRVASLAVMGCTNREIAEKLHVTASTVEQHLTRIFRKLNVKRRRDLSAELGGIVSTASPASH